MENSLVSKKLQIEGMTCSGCEVKIENKLKKLAGIKKVEANYKNSTVIVTYDANTLSLDEIRNNIEKLDYKIPDNHEESDGRIKKVVVENSSNKISINQLLGIGIILFAIYIIIKNTIGFNFIPQINQNMGYGILFVVGLITSLHCIAMCGGINISQCVGYRQQEGISNNVSKLKPSIMYNAGRVISYTVIGGIVGALGSVISLSGAANGIIAVLAGVFMVIMGINMLNIFPWLRKLNPRMPKVFGNKVFNNNGRRGPFYIGLLNGFMPCGPLQSMQIYALGTGSVVAGALSMFMFSLGTVPLMFGFGAISSLLSRKFTNKMMKVSAILVMILGIIMINRGMSLSGVNLSFASTVVENSASIAKVENNIQVATTTIEQGKYFPIVVQKGIPVKWTIKATESTLNGCNNAITIPKLNIQKKLVPGDNIIEFTPEEEGSITYTCWMGMISSSIKVVDDMKNVNIDEIKREVEDYTPPQNGCGGCCG